MFKHFSELVIGEKFTFYVFGRGHLIFTKTNHNTAITDTFKKDEKFKFNSNDLVEVI